MIAAVTNGRPSTAMQSFANTLESSEIAAVVDFVRQEFMLAQKPNTRYHTVENGWPDHQRYQAAFPFALGEILLDTPAETLTPEQRIGLQLFLNSCISCHDRANVKDEGEFWEPRAVSYPRNQYQHTAPQQADSATGATPYAKHDLAPQLTGLSAGEKEGEQLFQKNCAFCHAADGTGKNWIGSFLQPHPRNLTDPKIMVTMTRERLKQTIRDGLPGTTMSAWKDVLSDQQIDNIIAYINRAFHPIKE